jgi:hypothetical protein
MLVFVLSFMIRDAFMRTISGKEAPLSKSPPSNVIIGRSSLTDQTNSSTFFSATPSSKPTLSTPATPHTPTSASTNAAASIITILSEPTVLSSELELAADEIGEIVARHAYKIPVDEQGAIAATLVQFRPVSSK